MGYLLLVISLATLYRVAKDIMIESLARPS